MQRRKKASRAYVILSHLYTRAVAFAKRRPFTSFLIVLLFLFVAIAANAATAPKSQEVKKEEVAKEVEVYRIGKTAKTNVLAQIEKTGVVTIVAQSPGIVTAVHVDEGKKVEKGTTLVSLANNYAGGNASSISRQLAALQYQNTKDTYEAQKNLIGKQRELAEKTDANADELRSITDKSLSETRSLIDLNSSILATLDSNLATYEATNSAGVNDQLIFSTKQLKSQLTAGNNQLRLGLRTAEFQTAGDKPPAQLSDLQKDSAVGKLDLQQKALDLSLEIGRLQLSLAQVMEAAMFPGAPFTAVIESVHVNPGQSVNPGTPLVTLAGVNQEVSAVAKVPSAIAHRVSMLEESTVYIDGEAFRAKPDFVSHVATDGQLYTILFAIPKGRHGTLTDGEYIRIEIPVGVADTGTAVPFIPIDSVFQTQDQAFVYIVNGEKAASRSIELGHVVGAHVEILAGLSESDQVILTRNVLAGDLVSVKN